MTTPTLDGNSNFQADWYPPDSGKCATLIIVTRDGEIGRAHV